MTSIKQINGADNLSEPWLMFFFWDTFTELTVGAEQVYVAGLFVQKDKGFNVRQVLETPQLL